MMYGSFETEHEARVRAAGDLDADTIRRSALEDGVVVVIGKLAGGGAMVVEGYRFDAAKVSAAEAAAWLAERGIADAVLVAAEAPKGSHDRLEAAGPAARRWMLDHGILSDWTWQDEVARLDTVEAGILAFEASGGTLGSVDVDALRSEAATAKADAEAARAEVAALTAQLTEARAKAAADGKPNGTSAGEHATE